MNDMVVGLIWALVVMIGLIIIIASSDKAIREERRKECEYILSNNPHCQKLYSAIMYDKVVSNDEIKIMRLYAIDKESE